MTNLKLVGDHIELDGVVLFRATENLTPSVRLRLEEEFILRDDGVLRSPDDALNAHDEFIRGTRSGMERAKELAEFARRLGERQVT